MARISRYVEITERDINGSLDVQNELLISHVFLRRIVGWIGSLLCRLWRSGSMDYQRRRPRRSRRACRCFLSFEALAVFAFGISWFVKGQALLPILTDRELAEAAEAEPEPESVPVPEPSPTR